MATVLRQARPTTQNSPGLRQVGTELKQFTSRHRFLDARREELTRRYPNQWVCLTSNGTIVSGHNIDELLEKLERKKLSRQGAAIKLMTTEPKRMIL